MNPALCNLHVELLSCTLQCKFVGFTPSLDTVRLFWARAIPHFCIVCFLEHSCTPVFLCDVVYTWVQAEEFGRRLAHQFPWSPAASVAVGLALRRRYQSHSGAPSLAAHRKEIIRVSYLAVIPPTCLKCSC